MHPLAKFRYCPVCGSTSFEENSDKSKHCMHCGFEYFMNPSAANAAFILNANGELLVLTRDRDPAKGTDDLPGGFANIDETAEEGVVREVMEETGLHVDTATYLFSIPNTYLYSGLGIKTLDSFFVCHVTNGEQAKAMDDAAACRWVALADINPESFGLNSIRQGVQRFLAMHR